MSLELITFSLIVRQGQRAQILQKQNPCWHDNSAERGTPAEGNRMGFRCSLLFRCASICQTASVIIVAEKSALYGYEDGDQQEE